MAETRTPRNSGRLTDHLSIGVLTATVPRFLVDEVLIELNRREKRSRLLPAHVVVYFVMALALFADGYEEVIRALVNGLRYARTWSSAWTVPTSSALAQARARLGEEVMAELFWRVAVPVAKAATPGAWCERWRVMAIDGVMLDLPDTEANLAEYPKQGGTSPTPYPQARVVALAECGTHAILDATIGSMAQGERELAAPLTRSVDTSHLVTADRGSTPSTRGAPGPPPAPNWCGGCPRPPPCPWSRSCPTGPTCPALPGLRRPHPPGRGLGKVRRRRGRPPYAAP